MSGIGSASAQRAPDQTHGETCIDLMRTPFKLCDRACYSSDELNQGRTLGDDESQGVLHAMERLSRVETPCGGSNTCV
ncbi:hypothetical protein SMMN14_00726 [Sphaerulina musiva]